MRVAFFFSCFHPGFGGLFSKNVLFHQNCCKFIHYWSTMSIRNQFCFRHRSLQNWPAVNWNTSRVRTRLDGIWELTWHIWIHLGMSEVIAGMVWDMLSSGAVFGEIKDMGAHKDICWSWCQALFLENERSFCEVLFPLFYMIIIYYILTIFDYIDLNLLIWNLFLFFLPLPCLSRAGQPALSRICRWMHLRSSKARWAAENTGEWIGWWWKVLEKIGNRN